MNDKAIISFNPHAVSILVLTPMRKWNPGPVYRGTTQTRSVMVAFSDPNF
jgi:hypothetical protein